MCVCVCVCVCVSVCLSVCLSVSFSLSLSVHQCFTDCLLHLICPDGESQWSMKFLVKYEFGAHQIFESIRDGSPLTKFDLYLNEYGANTEAEPNYDKLIYLDMCFDILNDAPFVNMINKTDGRREYRRLPVNYSPRLLGMSRDGSLLYVICIEKGTCQSRHELKVVVFSTLKCEPGKGTWCEDTVGPFTLTTDVHCSEKLPRMAIAPNDADARILLDSNPLSGFLTCIVVERNQPPCKLDGDALHENRLEIQYFPNTSSHETLMQVQLMESFSQYMIDQFGSIRLIYPSNSAEQNPSCPMLSPTIFNCTVGMKFMNGTKLIHLSDAIGKPQSFQKNRTNGVAYVRQTRG